MWLSANSRKIEGCNVCFLVMYKWHYFQRGLLYFSPCNMGFVELRFWFSSLIDQVHVCWYSFSFFFCLIGSHRIQFSGWLTSQCLNGMILSSDTRLILSSIVVLDIFLQVEMVTKLYNGFISCKVKLLKPNRYMDIINRSINQYIISNINI